MGTEINLSSVLNYWISNLQANPLELILAFILWIAAFELFALCCIPIIGTALGNKTLTDILRHEAKRSVTTIHIEKIDKKDEK